MAAGWVSNSRFGSANRKLVLLVVAGYATEDASAIGIDVPDGWAVCWASITRIAEDAELSPATVRRVLGEMEAAGVIRRQHRGRKTGFGGRTTDAIWVEYGRPFVTQTDLALSLSGNPVDDAQKQLPALPEPDETDTLPEGLPLNGGPLSAQPEGGLSAHLVSAQEPSEEPPKNRQRSPWEPASSTRVRTRDEPRSSSDVGPASPAPGTSQPDLVCPNPDHLQQSLPCRLCAADQKAAI
jgi:hypothetical protein